MPGGPFESIPRKLRKATPYKFALYLYHRVAASTGSDPIAVLWTERKSNYWRLWPAVELWGRGLDARRYAGPWPCICHPPCGAWGTYHHVSKDDRLDGICAIEHVHKYGGIIEQPATSRLFREFGLPGTRIEKIRQSLYGFLSPKLTQLYICL